MITVSRAQPEDIPLAKDTLSVTWVDTYGSFLPLEVIEHVTMIWHDSDRLLAQAQDPNIYFGVAKDGGRVVGLITMRLLADDVGYVGRIYVHPDSQRQGIGAALLQAALAAFPTVKHLQLEVEERNLKGRAFYAKQGFRQIGTKQEDVEGFVFESLVMEKML